MYTKFVGYLEYGKTCTLSYNMVKVAVDFTTIGEKEKGLYCIQILRRGNSLWNVETHGRTSLQNIEVFDVFGRVVEIAHPPIKNSNPFSSPIHGGSPKGEGGWGFSLGGFCPPGIYFVRIQTETSVVVRKVVKK